MRLPEFRRSPRPASRHCMTSAASRHSGKSGGPAQHEGGAGFPRPSATQSGMPVPRYPLRVRYISGRVAGTVSIRAMRSRWPHLMLGGRPWSERAGHRGLIPGSLMASHRLRAVRTAHASSQFVRRGEAGGDRWTGSRRSSRAGKFPARGNISPPVILSEPVNRCSASGSGSRTPGTHLARVAVQRGATRQRWVSR